MKIYFAAVVASLTAAAVIVTACMLRDSMNNPATPIHISLFH
jgi:hypothetical protein